VRNGTKRNFSPFQPLNPVLLCCCLWSIRACVPRLLEGLSEAVLCLLSDRTYPATSAAERVSFRQVNLRTGHRLRHKLVDTVTGEAVDSSNKARGYELGENEFLLVEDRDLERARSERLNFIHR
jgi:hypothetical protein